MAPVAGAPGRVADRLGQCGRDLGGVGAQRGADGVRAGVLGAHRHRDRPRADRCGHRHQRAHRALVPEPHLTYVRDPDRAQQTARRLRPVPQCGRRDGDRPVECQEVQLRVERAQHHRHLVPGTSRHQIPAEGGPSPDPLGGDAAPAGGQARQGGPHPGVVRAGVMVDPGADLQRRAVPLDRTELGYALQRNEGPAVETLAELREEVAAALGVDRTAGRPRRHGLGRRHGTFQDEVGDGALGGRHHPGGEQEHADRASWSGAAVDHRCRHGELSKN